MPISLSGGAANAVVAACFALSATAFSGSAAASGNHQGGHFDFGAPGSTGDVDRTVEVALGDNFFEPEAIEVKQGETIRFVIENGGTFVHEFNIGTPQLHAQHQEEMQMMVEHGVLEPDHINHEMMKMDMGDGHTMEHDDPNSVLLEPGQSAEVIWTFSKPMALEFACNVPGHYEAGMTGTFRFVESISSR